jgi:hypothetical protein
MREERHFSPPAAGGSSLLAIFAVLCLTVFAMLSLSTVQADGRLADASAEAVSAYYAADCLAEEILARLRSGELPADVIQTHEPDGDTYSYTCPVSDTQMLEVEVRLHDTDWAVLRWQTVSTADWQAEDTLDLWDGDPVAELGT